MIPVLLGIHLPGPGTIYLSQSFEFLLPVHLGDSITASIKVIEKDDANKYVTFESLCVNGKGKEVLKGESVVSAPSETISWNAVPLVEFQMKA